MLNNFINFIFLSIDLSEGVLYSLLAFVGGIIVYISVDELLPIAHQYGHKVILGIVSDMFIMALSLLLL